MRFAGFLALASVALIGAAGTTPVRAATVEGAQVAQVTPATLPADIAAKITAAVKSGNPELLAATISALIADNPNLTNAIAMFAVSLAPNAAPTIAVAAAKAVQARGGDPTQVTLAVVAALEAQVQPAAGGAGGGLANAEVASLVRAVVTSVTDAVTLSASQAVALGGAPSVKQFSQVLPVTVNLPPVNPPPVNPPSVNPPPVNPPPASPH